MTRLSPGLQLLLLAAAASVSGAVCPWGRDPALAFLDLAQNSIRDLGQGSLTGLASLTALNLERNVIQALEADTFYGVNDTLSSLSQATLEENNS